jgi:hypothetical protein
MTPSDENTKAKDARWPEWNALEEAGIDLHIAADELRRLGRTGWASDVDRVAYEVDSAARVAYDPSAR